jgi:hypothetical protein
VSKTFFLLVLALSTASASAAEVPARAIPVEIWTAAHDDLTDRLSAAITLAMNDSQGFASSFGKKQGSLYVTITDRVHWKIMGARAQLTAPFAIADRPPNAAPLATGTVSCRDDQILECGGQVVSLAQSVATRAHAQSARNEREAAVSQAARR